MTIEAVASIPYFSALPEDVVVNTWHFDWVGTGDPTNSDYVNLANLIWQFYETVFGAAGATFMAPWMRPALAHMKMYDSFEPTPRAPVYDAGTALTVTQSGTVNTPTEVAACLSFHGDYVSGVAQASQRGRVFIGGLGAGCIANGATSTFPMISSTLRTNMGGAAGDILSTQGAVDWQWVVASRVLFPSVFPVVGGWVDDAPDTQRRRGQDATTRSLWP